MPYNKKKAGQQWSAFTNFFVSGDNRNRQVYYTAFISSRACSSLKRT
jgi:hypothetical protein